MEGRTCKKWMKIDEEDPVAFKLDYLVMIH